MIHPETPERFRLLPKFLIADSGGEREMAVRHYVVHCHYPRFFMEFTGDDNHQVTWVDDPASVLDVAMQEQNDLQVLDRLIAEACAFFKAELST